ncbi:MAG: glycosyltransferase family 9 protein [Gammaproteobacteria bacterium]|nr:MAG: glycosyltransferase family 9 protein [Gammaproteobacteria bacterium]
MLPLTAAPDNLCIVRLSALGDVTHAIPVLRAIQGAWPETAVTWICARAEHELLSVLPGVRFLVLDKSAGWRGYRSLRQQLSGEHFDLMLQLQVSARANLAGACVSADIKLGWDRSRARDLHRLFMTDAVPAEPRQHQVQGHLSFARTLGLDAREPAWNFPVTSDSVRDARQRLPGDQPTLLISPCSSHRQRNWRAARYAAVADYAIARYGMRVVLSGGPSAHEAATGRDIESATENPLHNLIGQVSLQQLMGLLQRASIVLSPDSGPAHMANALGTPVIGLHACTWSLRGGPYNFLDLSVDKFPEAAKKFCRQEPERLRWGSKIERPGVMDLIQTDEVISKLDLAVRRYLP